jgi:hypothetical protein
MERKNVLFLIALLCIIGFAMLIIKIANSLGTAVESEIAHIEQLEREVESFLNK